MTAIIRLSSRCLYACKALIALARLNPDQILRIPDIAGAQHIPERFLAHILLALKRKLIVRSIRGKQGGYRLARPPHAILLGEIVDAVCEISGDIRKGRKQDALASQADAGLNALILDQWREATTRFEQSLNRLSLQDIMDRLGAG